MRGKENDDGQRVVLNDPQIEAIEEIVDTVITSRGPIPFPLSFARNCVVHFLCINGLPIPDA